jgi:hypothetical protein
MQHAAMIKRTLLSFNDQATAAMDFALLLPWKPSIHILLLGTWAWYLYARLHMCLSSNLSSIWLTWMFEMLLTPPELFTMCEFTLTSLMGKRNTPRSGTHPRASFALLSRFYATLFLSLSICLSILKKTLLALLRPTVIVNIPRSESVRTRLTSYLQLSRSGFRLGLLALNHMNRKRYSRLPKNRLF